MKKIINWFKSSSSDFVLFLILLVLINIAGFNAFKRFDLTGPKSYSLSQASRNLVKNLEEPLSVRVFFDKNLPAPYNSVAQYVEDFLNEYKSAANNNFTVTSMDMNKEENIELASDFNLRQIQIQEFKDNEVGFKQVYMGLVIAYGDLVEKIDPITTADGFEYSFTSTISKMMNTSDSLSVLKGDDKISIRVIVTDSLRKLGIQGCEQIETVVSQAFANINKQKQDKLKLEIVRPNPIEAQQLIEKYGVQGIYYETEDGNSEIGAFGVVVEYGDNFKVLPVLVQQSFFGYAVSGYDVLEDSINESIQSLMSKSTPVGYITGNGEINIDDERGGKTFGSMLSSMYELQQLNLITQDIPSNINSIIINGPKYEFSEIELYRIDQFIMRGGNVMIFIDGLIENSDRQSYYQGGPDRLENPSDLDKLLESYGIKREMNIVMDTNCFENVTQQYGKINMYWAPMLQKEQLQPKHPVTNNLGYVLFVNAGSLDVDSAINNPDVNVTVLAKSSENSWTEGSDVVIHPLTVNPPADTNLMKSENLAVLLEGKFKSAFDQAPVFDIPGVEKTEVKFEAKNHISESRLPGKIFVAGTSEITTYSVLGSAVDPIGNPVQVMEANLVDYMNGNEDLCIMRSKGLSVNTITIKNQVFAKIIQYFNEFGLTVLVALAGLLVWRLRSRRKARINSLYNPDDQRTIEKKSKKSEKKGE